MKRLALWLFFFSGVASLACRRNPFGGRPPVILITIDTLRADHLPTYGDTAVETPAISRLASEGIVFENAFSQVPLTLPSHLTILTGLLPYQHLVRDNLGYRLSARAATLAELLGARGYRTGAAVSASVLASATGASRGFDFYDDRVTAGEKTDQAEFTERAGLETAAALEAWIARPDSRPIFAWLHIYEPHAPYDPPEPWKTRYRDRPYDGEIAAADAVLGQFLAHLAEQGLGDRALIILAGDHGEGLGDHGEDHHGLLLYREDLRVPLIVRMPGRRRAGLRVSGTAALADILPTICEVAGCATPPGAAGQSLFSVITHPDAHRTVYSETLYPRLIFGWSDLAAEEDARYQYIEAPAPEFYDMEHDPLERKNLFDARPPDLSRLARDLARRDRTFTPAAAADAEQARKLAALGYLTPSISSEGRSGPRPDPKTRIASYRRLEEAATLIGKGDRRGAEEPIRDFLRSNPEYVNGWKNLAFLCEQSGQPAEAAAALEKAMALSPDDRSVILDLARDRARSGRGALARDLGGRLKSVGDLRLLRATIAAAEGDLPGFLAAASPTPRAPEMEPLARRFALELAARGHAVQAAEALALFRDSGDAQTLAALGMIQIDSGRKDDGMEFLERAVQAKPEDASLHENLGVAALKLGRDPLAEAELTEAVRRDPSRTEAWNALGVLRTRQNRNEEALDAFRRSVDADPGNFQALSNFASLAVSAGHSSDAASALSRFLSRPSGAPEDRRLAAELLRQIAGRR